MTSQIIKQRRHELDWLRVFAFFLLIFFHAGMPFVAHNWHINNAETSIGMTYLWDFFHNWRMPLLFVISGAGIWYALGNKTGTAFVKERMTRLLIPLVFGVFVIVAPQVYFQRMFEGQIFNSYIDFYPHFFDGHVFEGGKLNPSGNFTPNHLWFIYALFFYCIAALPLLLFLKSSYGKLALNKFTNLLTMPMGIYIMLLPLYLSLRYLKPYGMEYVFEYYHLVLVVIGFILVSRDKIMVSIQSHRLVSIIIATGFISYSMYAAINSISLSLDSMYFLNAFGYGSLIFAFLGYARRYLNFSNAFLKYTNEAVYPFYILHQTITVMLAFYIVPMDMNIWIKFLMTSLGTAVFTLAIYHFLIKPFNIIRPLFGLNTLKTAKIKTNEIALCIDKI